MIKTGIVPRFTEFLTYDSCPELQYEAAWVLTNICSGDKEQVVFHFSFHQRPHMSSTRVHFRS